MELVDLPEELLHLIVHQDALSLAFLAVSSSSLYSTLSAEIAPHLTLLKYAAALEVNAFQCIAVLLGKEEATLSTLFTGNEKVLEADWAMWTFGEALCQAGNAPVLEAFLEKSSDRLRGIPSGHFSTWTFGASQTGHVEVLEVLLRHGVDLNESYLELEFHSFSPLPLEEKKAKALRYWRWFVKHRTSVKFSFWRSLTQAVDARMPLEIPKVPLLLIIILRSIDLIEYFR